MLQLVKYYKFFLALSGLLVAASLVMLFVWGLNLGIDFRGGSLLELRFDQTPDTVQVAKALTDAGYSEILVQPAGKDHVIIKTQSFHSDDERTKLLELLKKNYGSFEELRFDSIGPIIGAEMRGKAYWQVILVVIGILLYIAYAFRRVSGGRSEKKITSWKMSLAAVIALIHDLLIVLGLFAFLGKFLHVEIDSLFITALLTVLGFSVHDTIVVFDRVRENLQRGSGESFAEILNYSVSQTLTRSINTSVTVLLVLLVLALFGGGSIFYFVIALLAGITVGTYSSIYVASAFLLVWNTEKR